VLNETGVLDGGNPQKKGSETARSQQILKEILGQEEKKKDQGKGFQIVFRPKMNQGARKKGEDNSKNSLAPDGFREGRESGPKKN